MNGRAYAPARADINADFPLCGAIVCGSCDSMMTSCWSKSKTGKKHPYYMCFQKGCADYRKSIRRGDIEGAFEAMLQALTPRPSLIEVITAMFKDGWEQQAQQTKSKMKDVKASIVKIEDEIGSVLDRIISASNERVIESYETKIDTLEKYKLVLLEKLQNRPKNQKPFSEVFELCLKFLSSPYNIWKNRKLEDQKMVLRLAFDKPLTWVRGEGFRTPETSSVFSALDKIIAPIKVVAVGAVWAEAVSTQIPCFTGYLQGKFVFPGDNDKAYHGKAP